MVEGSASLSLTEEIKQINLHTCIYIYIYIYIYTYKMCAYVPLCVFLCMQVCMHAWMPLCVCVCARVCERESETVCTH